MQRPYSSNFQTVRDIIRHVEICRDTVLEVIVLLQNDLMRITFSLENDHEWQIIRTLIREKRKEKTEGKGILAKEIGKE